MEGLESFLQHILLMITILAAVKIIANIAVSYLNRSINYTDIDEDQNERYIK